MVSRIQSVTGAAVVTMLVLLVALLGSGIVPLGAPDRPVGSGSVSAAATNNFDQLVVVLMENKNLNEVYGPAPYMTLLADQYAFAQHWASLANPSQPNYIGLLGGSLFGVAGDGNHPNLNHPTLVDLIENAGKTWKAFAEDAGGSGCGLSPPRGEDHFPFLSYTTITGNAARCANLLPGSSNEVVAAFNGGTNFIWLTPNDCNNMHSCPVSTGDSWLQSWIPTLLTAMTGKKAALLLMFDEAYTNPPYIYMGFSGPAVKLAYKSTMEYNHYSLAKLIEDVWGGGSLGQGDVSAPSPVEFFLPGGPDFSLTANPASVSFGTGQSASSAISLSSTGGFASTVNLTAVSVPAGVTTSCLPSSLSGSGTSTCTLAANMTGSYVVTVTGTNGTAFRIATIDVTVSPPDFSLTANPNRVSFVVNHSAVSTITLKSTGGFSGTVSLNATSSPSGVTTSCSPTTLVGSQSSTCLMNATTIGSYTVTIIGTGGNLTHTASIDVTVTAVPATDFSLLANPSAVVFVAGESASATIDLQPMGGFAGTVDLTTASSPTGLALSCAPSSIAGSQTSTCTLSGSTVGSYTATITGTSRPLVRTTSISVVVKIDEPLPDTVPPQIAITFPSNSSVLASANVTVKGAASDNVAIQRVELSTDNLTWIRTNGTASWSANVKIAPGTTTIYARATDAAGNRKTVLIRVFMQSAGGFPPPPPADGSPLVVNTPIPLNLMTILLGVAAAGEALLYIWTRRPEIGAISDEKPVDPSARAISWPLGFLHRLLR